MRRARKPGARKPHRNDVEEVVVAQRVQDGGDGLPGDGQPEAFHAPTHVHQDDDVLWRRGGLDVPESGGEQPWGDLGESFQTEATGGS